MARSWNASNDGALLLRPHQQLSNVDIRYVTSQVQCANIGSRSFFQSWHVTNLLKGNTALIRRALATAQREIDRAERNFHQVIRSIQKPPATSVYRSTGMTSRVSGPAPRAGKPAPVQTAITKVLSKRRRGLTMDRLQEALPHFDEKSLLNATFAMRQKGLIEFDRSGVGRGVYRWQ